jgi:putative drug exporter of the RND superfamily
MSKIAKFNCTSDIEKFRLSALTVAAERRLKFLVLAVWLLVSVVIFPLASDLDAVLRDDPISYLPRKAESVEVIRQLEQFPSGATIPAVIVFNREGGLIPRDRTYINKIRNDLNSNPPVATQSVEPPTISEDESTALLIAPIQAANSSEDTVKAVLDIRERVSRGVDGLIVKVTGPAGNRSDLEAVFDSINGTVLLGSAGIILVLLIVVYRSPIFWLLPMIGAICADLVSRGLCYLLANAGFIINDQSANILPVLVFGSGTDYALLLVARYREKLRRYQNKHLAMANALRSASPAIIASGLTTIVALLALLLAQLNGVSGLAAVGSIGIAVAMMVMTTLLPAILLLFGRAIFWPFIPSYASESPDEDNGLWTRIGEAIARHHRPIWIGTVAILIVMSFGLLNFNTQLTRVNGYLRDVDAVQGMNLLYRAFPDGVNAPATVVVSDPSQTEKVRTALRLEPGVASLGPVEQGKNSSRFDLILETDPYSNEAFQQIATLRKRAKEISGLETLIGGPTAEEYDVRVAAARDERIIIPLVFLVVFVILVLLLRSLVAPLLLIGTIVLSFAAALGTGTFVSLNIFGFAGIDPSVALIAFVFLVGGGVDYVIFLMARVREETLTWGTRLGMTRGLAATGAVITSAGLASAGTFSILAILPLALLIEIGFIIAFGVLLDTFIVRSILVPSLTYELGSLIWWPSALTRSRD